MTLAVEGLSCGISVLRLLDEGIQASMPLSAGAVRNQRVDYNPRTDFTDPASLKDQSMGLFSVKKMIELAGLKPISLNRRRTSL